MGYRNRYLQAQLLGGFLHWHSLKLAWLSWNVREYTRYSCHLLKEKSVNYCSVITSVAKLIAICGQYKVLWQYLHFETFLFNWLSMARYTFLCVPVCQEGKGIVGLVSICHWLQEELNPISLKDVILFLAAYATTLIRLYII